MQAEADRPAQAAAALLPAAVVDLLLLSPA
jgi:hypothetical protein